MFKYFDHKVIKTALASFLAYFFADYFGIKYGLTASIIAIISIQATKADSIRVTIERFLAVFLGMSLFILLAYILGFQYITLGVFILLFMPLCIKLNILQGFLVTTVLATHILSEKSISLTFMLNEFYVLILGLFVGNILNLYMPTNSKKIDFIKKNVDSILKTILIDISESLKCNCVSVNEDKNFKSLKSTIENGRKFSLLDYDNSLFDKCNENLNFFSMRRRQYRILTRMRACFKRLYITHEYSLIISDFIFEVAENIEIEKKTSPLLAEHKELKLLFSNFPLPKSRSEFENRANLFQLLQELEEFLNAKIEFKKDYEI
ncbi:aromatic acid exporter family protein [Cetobacterium sp. 8H]|uniref:aromatic acid exporter family protein n=1 Tax=Cetobacterium sp. 8H TaxID=2759681 RepID=UPI00163CA596|nr:aromatic acid exporter family protein [Cetobacterium sp. 8H]MBC2850407.1 aromatic acid exporter family protein [Cetobacterium sp. 8H]